MRKPIAVLSLLLVGVLHAGSFQSAAETNVTSPVGGVEIDTLRTETSNAYRLPSGQVAAVISAEAVNFTDTLSKVRKYDFTVKDTVAGIYTKYIRPTDRWAFAFNEQGNFRWRHRRGDLRIDPTFNRDSVDIDFQFTKTGMKAAYVLRSTAPTTLTWNWDFIPSAAWPTPPTNTQIRDWVLARMPAPVAWDANGDTVDVVRSYDATSMTFTVDTSGAVWPITVDPTVNDTALGARSKSWDVSGASWVAARGKTDGDGGTPWASAQQAWIYNNWSIARIFLTFPMTALPVPTSVDSVRFFLPQTAGPTTPDTSFIILVKGTFSGDTTKAWFNDIEGWQTGVTPYTSRKYTDSPHFVFLAGQTGVKSVLLNDSAKVDIKAAMGADSLRVVLLDRRDDDAVGPTSTKTYVQLGAAPTVYMAIYYTAEPPTTPGVHALGSAYDTLKVVGLAPKVTVAAKVDSSGSTAIDSAGIRYWKKSAGNDTLTTKAAYTLDADSIFSVQSDSLLADTVFVFQPMAHNGAGWSYSATMDTVSTTVSLLTVTVVADTSTYVTVTFYGSADTTGPGKPVTRGFQVWPRGSTVDDTIGVSETTALGYNSAAYSLSADSIPADTVMQFRSYAINAKGKAFSGIDSVFTYVGAASVSVTDTVIVNTGTSTTIAPRKPGKFAGKSNR